MNKTKALQSVTLAMSFLLTCPMIGISEDKGKQQPSSGATASLDGWARPISLPIRYRLKDYRKEEMSERWTLINEAAPGSFSVILIVRATELPDKDTNQMPIEVAALATATAAGDPTGKLKVDLRGSWKLDKSEMIKNDLVLLGQNGVTITKPGDSNPSPFDAVGGTVSSGKPAFVFVGGASPKKDSESLLALLKAVDGLCTELKLQLSK